MSCKCHDHDGHCHDHSHSGENEKFEIIMLIVCAVAAVCGMLIGGIAGNIILAVSAVVVGRERIIKGVKNLFHLDFDENLLITIAVAASFAIGEFTEGALVMLLSQLGEIIEDRASVSSRRAIEELSQLRPDKVHAVNDKNEQYDMKAEDVQIGDMIVVRPYERIPLDGVVVSGFSALDTSAITGESLPVDAQPGTEVLGGMNNTNGMIVIRVTAGYEDSAAARIIRMVSESAELKGESERMITRFSRIYTPCVVAAAVLLVLVPVIFGAPFILWLKRALMFLVASCPCAIVISVPLGFFSAIGGAAKKGILIKGGVFVEQLSRVDTVAFDKTGTLTTGELVVSRVNPADGYTAERVLSFAAAAEKYSSHPAARAICKSAEVADIDGEHSEIAGQGTVLDGQHRIAVGNAKLMENEGADIRDMSEGIYVSLDGKVIGSINVSDTPRVDAAQTISALRAGGVRHVALLTGDSAAHAAPVADNCGIREVYASLTPGDKVTRIKELSNGAKASAFVGDGINDAPVLTAADIGIAMGLGTDAAVEAADVVLLSVGLSLLPKAVSICRRAMRTVKFNIAFALIAKAAAVAVCFSNPVMWIAVAADVGVMIITVLNSVRLLTSADAVRK